jgi:type IX secretion system PorP/SprF family membrane protein
MKRRSIVQALLILGVLCSVEITRGQDINYSQYFSTPIFYNPAFTGINSGLRARFLFRDQWPTLPVDLKSYYFAADLGDRNLPGAGGIGLTFQQDNPGLGLIKNFTAALSISVRIPITSFMIAQVGIKAAVVQRTVNWDDLVFADQLDAKYGNIYQTTFIPPDASKRVVPDFAAGGILQFMNGTGSVSGNVGFAVDHIFKPDVSFLSTGASPYPRKWVAHGDVVIAAGQGGSTSTLYHGGDEPLKINLGVLYQNQANLNSLMAGLNLLKYNVYLGAWYKSTLTGVVNSSVVLLAGYRYMFMEDMSIKFMYSYDLQISGALNGTGGAHEISLVLEFDKLSLFGGGSRKSSGFIPGGSRNRSSGPMECPSFY